MIRGTLSVKSINYTGIRLVLPALFVMCICSCASFVKDPSTRAATIELKNIAESMTMEDIAKIQETIQAGADVNVRTKFGVTPLWMASQKGHAEIVKLLLTAKADVNAADKTEGVTPLWMASKYGRTEIVKLLLTAKADVNPKTDGYTPLLSATYDGNTEIVKLLLTAEADVNAADRWGDTSLLIASYKGYTEIVKLLLTAGADANVNPGRKINCFTPLMAASENGYTEIVKLLLAAGADVNAADKTEGVTPLLMTSLYGYTEIVKLLLAAGADVNFMISIYGIDHTPLSLAKEMSHTDIVQLLIGHGAKDRVPSSATRPHRTSSAYKAKKESSEVKSVAATMGGKKITNSLGMEFVYINPGTFMMGSPTNESGRDSNEKQHRITLTKGFYMGVTEVTLGQWTEVMGNYPSYFRNYGVDCPVEQISWNDVQTFIRKLNRKEGTNRYRLPKEAEWEYAARAGSTTALANGEITGKICDYDSNLDAMGWYCGNSDRRTHRVAGKKPNKWGLYDMHGNVWEWCQDWYESYSSGSVIDPKGPSSGSSRVFRGGGWQGYPEDCRSAIRGGNTPGSRFFFLGFRLVLSRGD